MKIKYIFHVIFIIASASLAAQATVWTLEKSVAAEGNWLDAANWRDGVLPTENTKTVFNLPNAADCIVDDTVTAKQLVLGDNWEFGGTLIIREGGFLTTQEEGFWSTLGYNKGANMRIESGGVFHSAHRFHVGLVPPSTEATPCLLEIAGTLSAPKFTVNDPGIATWQCETRVLPGGELYTSLFFIGDGGSVDVSGGTIYVAGNHMTILSEYVSAGKLTADRGLNEPTIAWEITGDGSTADTVTVIKSSTTGNYLKELVNYCLNETAVPLYAEEDSLKWAEDPEGPYTISPITPLTSETGTKKYFLTGTKKNVDTDTTEMIVTVYKYEATAQDTMTKCGNKIYLPVHSNYIGSGLESFSWETDEGTFEGPTLLYYPKNNDTITLKALTSTGCSSSSTTKIAVQPASNALEMEMVSTNAQGQNEIYWGEKKWDHIDSIIICSRNSGNDDPYVILGLKSYYDPEMHFTDQRPVEKQINAMYMLKLLDMCGSITEPKQDIIPSMPVRLAVSNINNDGNLLQWSAYQGRAVLKYEVLKGVAPEQGDVIFSTPFEQNFYDTPATSDSAYYWIRTSFVEPMQYPDLKYSYSNIIKIKRATATRNDEAPGSQIKLYPNPADDYIFIEADNAMNIKGHRVIISDMRGGRIYESPLHAEKWSVDISDLPHSVFVIIRIIDEDGTSVCSKKILLE